VEALESKYGPFPENAGYLARYDGTRRAVAAPSGSSSYPMVSRLDLWKQHAGIDLQTMFPAGTRDSSQVDGWTYQAFLEACKKLHAAGSPFGNPISDGSDSAMWLAPLLLAFGSQLMTADGDIAVDSDGTRAGLEFLNQLTEYMPRDISSGTTLPTTAGSLRARAPRCKFHRAPGRLPGRRPRTSRRNFGTMTCRPPEWPISRCPAGLLRDLELRRQQARCKGPAPISLPTGSGVRDCPQLSDHEVWQKAGPPTGTLYNYPVHGDEAQVVPGYPAPPDIAGKIAEAHLIANLVAKVTRDGQSKGDAIAWAEGELERITKA
jgi:hypothetical protein